jgi:hypothetical protein
MTDGLAEIATMTISVELRVELRGLEPLTPSLRTRCATSCATAPDAAADATISRQG